MIGPYYQLANEEVQIVFPGAMYENCISCDDMRAFAITAQRQARLGSCLIGI
ncbi:uncharacterized protein RCO7_15233 [Rhynchosporium graminicola]|uniref:Uncharacterized protein n=2 Tax=Rhynchosporium TaxID=38037 RepID=A0A1E1MBC2_RHYSE|nr:uncharacterized protein RCO7_15233 [Rhynchosporium commune]CZT46387.1 uncharacterized protein RSE6_06808 [Rhynchosporium secalis]